MKLTFIMTSMVFIIIMTTLSQKLVSMGALVLSSALMTTILLIYLVNSWFGLILFLVYVTGVLVIFSYFIAMSPNIQQTAKKCFKSYSVVFVIFSLMTWNLKATGLPTYKMDYENDVVFMIKSVNLTMYWFMALILLFALLMVVSITYKTPSPLRNYLQ